MEKEKELIGFDDEKKKDIMNVCRNWILGAETLRAFAGRFDQTLTLDELFEFSGHQNKLQDHILAKEVERFGTPDNHYANASIVLLARQKYEEFNPFTYADNAHTSKNRIFALPESWHKYVYEDCGQIKVNEDLINEDCNVYLEGNALKARKGFETIVKTLNEICNGKPLPYRFEDFVLGSWDGAKFTYRIFESKKADRFAVFDK